MELYLLLPRPVQSILVILELLRTDKQRDDDIDIYELQG